MSELQTIYDCERAKFNGFGTYKLPIEERVHRGAASVQTYRTVRTRTEPELDQNGDPID